MTDAEFAEKPLSTYTESDWLRMFALLYAMGVREVRLDPALYTVSDKTVRSDG